jgi:hypothetical protein
MVVEAQRHLTVRDILVDGIGGTLPAIAAMRFALGCLRPEPLFEGEWTVAIS